MNTILMIGPQGAGKGTQADGLADKLGIPTISVGKLFRSEIEKGTGLGRTIAEYVDRGDRVPEDIVDRVVEDRLEESDVKNGMILDGYPRTLAQVKVLETIFQKAGLTLTHALLINVPDEEAVARLSGRWICSNLRCEANYHEKFNPPKIAKDRCDRCGSLLVQRDDDKPDAIRHRLELYHRDTEPVIDYYRKQGILHEVDGTKAIADVAADLMKIFS